MTYMVDRRAFLKGFAAATAVAVIPTVAGKTGNIAGEIGRYEGWTFKVLDADYGRRTMVAGRFVAPDGTTYRQGINIGIPPDALHRDMIAYAKRIIVKAHTERHS